MGRRPKPVSSLPPNWPTSSQVTYLTSPVYSPQLTSAQMHTIHEPPPQPEPKVQKLKPLSPPTPPIESPTHIPPVKILPINSPLHPAYPQSGLFATRALTPNSFIVFYVGYVHNEADNDATSSYDLSMDRNAGIAVDATTMGNESRFVNDYRGVPGREDRGPNAEFRDCWVRLNSGKGGKGGKVVNARGMDFWEWERRVGVYVLPAGRSGKRKEGVKAGEEILVSYGKGFWCKAREEDGNAVSREEG